MVCAYGQFFMGFRGGCWVEGRYYLPRVVMSCAVYDVRRNEL